MSDWPAGIPRNKDKQVERRANSTPTSNFAEFEHPTSLRVNSQVVGLFAAIRQVRKMVLIFIIIMHSTLIMITLMSNC